MEFADGEPFLVLTEKSMGNGFICRSALRRGVVSEQRVLAFSCAAFGGSPPPGMPMRGQPPLYTGERLQVRPVPNQHLFQVLLVAFVDGCVFCSLSASTPT